MLKALYMLAIVLLPFSIGCTNGEGKGTETGAGSNQATEGFGGRVALVQLRTTDSASLATTSVVDAMLLQAFDSVEQVEYVSVQETGILEGKEVSVQTIAEKHHLDHLISVSVARFGSVVGVSMSISGSSDGSVSYRDQTFSFIRFRDSDGTPLFGPGLYEAMYRHILRVSHTKSGPLPDGRVVIAAAEPIIIASVQIPADSSLGRVFENREKISRDAVRALADFSAITFNEFVVFDHESRSRLYNVRGLDQVNDLQPVGDLEREAMHDVNVPFFLSIQVSPEGSESLRIRADIHEVTSRSSDRIRFSHEAVYETGLFQTSTVVRDVVAEILVVAKGALQKGADFIESY